MSHHAEEEAGGGHAHPAPGIPEVKDEAGNSPTWLPKLGVGLGLVLAALIAFLIVQAQKDAPADAPAADEKTEAAAP